MKNTSKLYDTLIQILGQHAHWLDKRHLYTLIWMIIHLTESKTISLPEWAPFVDSRATFVQSTVRQFSRWLNNKRIKSFRKPWQNGKMISSTWRWILPCSGIGSVISVSPLFTEDERFP